jgi:hypothetical protein
MCLDDFELLGTIGHGAYSTVILAMVKNKVKCIKICVVKFLIDTFYPNKLHG